MTLSVLKKLMGAFVAAMLLGVVFTACSDDNSSEPDSSNPFIGAWQQQENSENDKINFFVFDPTSVVWYETTPTLLAGGYYSEKYVGTYNYNGSTKTATVNIDGIEIIFHSLTAGEISTGVFDHYSKVRFSEVPTKKAVSNDPPVDEPTEGRDELSSTSWMVTSMTGWGASAFSDYKGMQLRFGANGDVTEWYDSSDNYKGTYSVSGNNLNLSSLPITTQWGESYEFSVSTDRLTLISGKGTSMATTFILTKI